MVAAAGSACGSRPQSGRCLRSGLACPGTRQAPCLECRSGVSQAPPGLAPAPSPWPAPPVLTPSQDDLG